MTTILADGSESVTTEYPGEVNWLDQPTPVGILAAAEGIALFGMHLMRDSRLTVCARDGTVRIEQP